jgi:hypothetical protein
MKKTKTFIQVVASVLLFVSMSFTYGQDGSIKGKITDKASSEVIPYASVVVSNKTLSKVATSDITGNYIITIAPGVYKIKIQYVGYKESEIKDIMVVKDSITVEDIALDASVATLDMIEIMDGSSSHSKSTAKRSVSSGETYSPSYSIAAKYTYDDRGYEEVTTISSDYDKSVAGLTSKSRSFRKSPTSSSTGSGSAGLLTAGELNDFTKWDLWNDLAESTLKTWQDQWQFAPIDRYSIQIVNRAGKPVVDATVQLLSAKGKLIWESKTDNTGKAEMWADIYAKSKDTVNLSISVIYNNKTYDSDKITEFKQGINVITIPAPCDVPKNIDIMFMVDATGSMSDEISYLKAELLDVINGVKEKYPDNTVNLGCVFYRDRGDEYVTKKFDLTSNIEKVIAFINQQYAGGGGDAPEAVDSALSVSVNDISWSEEAVARILFIICDAPPHYNTAVISSLQKNIMKASSIGIRIVPVIGSGMTKDGEYINRAFALATNGNYIFLTDHSGIGGTHLKPTTDEYDVTLLKDLLRKTIENFVYVVPCDEQVNVKDIKDTMYINNPNIIAHVVIDSTSLGRYNVPNQMPDTNKINFVELMKPDTSNIVITDTTNTSRTDTTKTGQADVVKDFHSFKYYPNPTEGQLFIEVEGDAKEIYLADINGKLLEKYTISERKIEINISKYATGIYFLEYMYKGKWLTGKVVLQK